MSNIIALLKHILGTSTTVQTNLSYYVKSFPSLPAPRTENRLPFTNKNTNTIIHTHIYIRIICVCKCSTQNNTHAFSIVPYSISHLYIIVKRQTPDLFIAKLLFDTGKN